MNDHAETYRVLETDAVNWLETAEGLLTSAKLSWNALRETFNEPPSETRVDRIAYMQSLMLLTALAFENVCRGIAVFKKPEGWRHLANRRGGHDLIEAVPEFVQINDEERDLLRRLETYLRWAGKYVIPKRSDEYVDAVENRRRTVKSRDWELANELFSRLKAELQMLAEASAA